MCSKCLNNFTITADKLKCNPLTVIENCQWYKDNISTCQLCKFGFYISNNQCLPATQVKDCKTYSLTENKCLEC